MHHVRQMGNLSDAIALAHNKKCRWYLCVWVCWSTQHQPSLLIITYTIYFQFAIFFVCCSVRISWHHQSMEGEKTHTTFYGKRFFVEQKRTNYIIIESQLLLFTHSVKLPFSFGHFVKRINRSIYLLTTFAEEVNCGLWHIVILTPNSLSLSLFLLCIP